METADDLLQSKWVL